MDYFPLALAAGNAFCNRIQEQKVLKYNIAEARPTLIVSPRRYGKTSLAQHVIAQSQLHYAAFDFLSAIDIDDIEKIILKGIGQLLARLEKGPKKILKIATDFFAGLNIKLSFDAVGLSIEINKKSTHVSSNILNILQRLEKLSDKYQEQFVLLFDEFQRIYQIVDNQAIESVIRQVAQASKSLSFIFSGSNRHLLHQMFDDRNRPFYKLCDRITLNRIDEKDYILYIQKAASNTGKKIAIPAIEQIFHYTRKHPYYMNLLCSRLWKLTDNIRVTDVHTVWQYYALEERSQVANELDLLSSAQRKLLIALARIGGTNAPSSQQFQAISGIPASTAQQALKQLQQRDYIHCNEEGLYTVLDPMLEYILA